MRGICHNHKRERREKKRKLGEVSGWGQDVDQQEINCCALYQEKPSPWSWPNPQFLNRWSSLNAGCDRGLWRPLRGLSFGSGWGGWNRSNAHDCELQRGGAHKLIGPRQTKDSQHELRTVMVVELGLNQVYLILPKVGELRVGHLKSRLYMDNRKATEISKGDFY